MYYKLPLTEDPRQVFTLDMNIDGDSFHARTEIRYRSQKDMQAYCMSILRDTASF